MQASERLEQHRFARPRPTGDAEDLARQHVEADVIVQLLLAEAIDDAASGKDRLRLGRGVHSPTFSNRIENSASSTITRKIDFTTARVVSRPTLSAEPRTRNPCMQPMMAITNANTGALTRPTKRSLASTD